MSAVAPQLEIRVIEYWAKNGGFATKEDKHWKVQLWRTDLGTYQSLGAGSIRKQEQLQIAKEWSMFVDAPIAEFEERRQYTTALVRVGKTPDKEA